MKAELLKRGHSENLKIDLIPEEIPVLRKDSVLSGKLKVVDAEIIDRYAGLHHVPSLPAPIIYPFNVFLVKEDLRLTYGVELIEGSTVPDPTVWDLLLDERPCVSLEKYGVFIGSYARFKGIEIRTTKKK